jgi:hypothetical protein
MKTVRILTSLLLASLTLMSSGSGAVVPIDEEEGWSRATNGLQARLTLIEKGELHGTRWLVPFFELRNVSNIGNQMEVNCDDRHLKVELVDVDGKSIRDGWLLPRSGPASELNTVILPWASSIRISLENRIWGVPTNAAAMVSTDSGALVIGEQEKGRMFLRATLTGESNKSDYKKWSGSIQTPLMKVNWK